MDKTSVDASFTRTAYKSAARAQALGARAQLSPACAHAYARRATSHLLASSLFDAATHVLCYASLAHELSTRECIRAVEAAHKRLYLPRVHASSLEWYQVGADCFDRPDHLITSSFGIPEPNPRYYDCEDLALLSASDTRMLIIVPGLVFDMSGYRLGYGGGYFDRVLAASAEYSYPVWSCGLCFSMQIVPSLAARALTDPHDRAVDALASEEGFLCVSAFMKKKSY